MADELSIQDQQILLSVARSSINEALQKKPLAAIHLEGYSQSLQEKGACFVTLNTLPYLQLRGCIGTLEAYQPLILDVQERAISAALEDYRFPPVSLAEMDRIQIEVSRLTPPQELNYQDSQDLVKNLQPGIDGVILKDGMRRATFLPQVWDKIPSPEHFLSQLCQKMGASSDLWQRKKLQVLIYHVQEFHE